MTGRVVTRIAIITVFAAFSARLNAQVVNSIVYGGDAVSAAVSGASVAMDANAFAVENNAASMALSKGTMSAAASYSILQPSAVKKNLISAAGFYKVSSRIAVGADLKYLGYDPYDIVAADGRVTSQFTPNEIAGTVGVAYAFTERISAGAGVSYAMMSLAEGSVLSTVGVDISAMYSAGALSAGVNARNLGTDVMDLRGGAAYRLSFLKAFAQAEYLSGAGFMAAAGAEYSFKEMVFARAGVHYGGPAAIPTSFSVGAGARFAGISADICYVIAGKAVGNNLCFSLGYSF